MKAPWTAWLEYKERRDQKLFNALDSISENIAHLIFDLAQQRQELEREKLEVLKRQLPVEAVEVPKKPDVPLPGDILMYCKEESEKWAREDKEKLARQLYEEYGDWDKVREVLS